MFSTVFFKDKKNSVYYNGVIFNPLIKNGNVFKWAANYQNLRLEFQKDVLIIKNSFHKFYHGNNYCDLYLNELRQALLTLSKMLKINILDAKVVSIEYGCNISMPQVDEFISGLTSYNNRHFSQMIYKSVIHGKKVTLTDYSLKFYNKKTEISKFYKRRKILSRWFPLSKGWPDSLCF